MSRRTKVRLLAALAIGLALLALFWPRENRAAREQLDRLRGAIEVESGPADIERQEVNPREQMVEVRFCLAKLCLTDATAGLFAAPGQEAKVVHGRVRSLHQVEASIERLSIIGVLDIVTQPQTINLSGQASYIMSGSQIPVLSSKPGQAPEVVAFQDIGCKTSVVPTVWKDGTPQVEVEAELSWLTDGPAPAPTSTANPTPPKISRVSTGTITARLRSGETLAVAGLRMNGRGVKTLKAPLLSRLPGVGGWFSWTYERDVEEELIVLVTPRVLPKQP
jgi:type II secretory pathway component GspD/PulD (secretin)